MYTHTPIYYCLKTRRKCVTTAMQHFLHSAILYLNDNFSGGELFFTNRDAKTVTVSCLFQPKVTLPLCRFFLHQTFVASLSRGHCETQLWPPGGFLLGPRQPARRHRGDRWSAVRAGPLVHQGEALQGQGESRDTALTSDLQPVWSLML